MSLRTILIVEPNPGVLIVGRNLLARAGFSVTAVPSVDEGLGLARRHAPDVVLLDGRVADASVLRTLARTRPGGVPVVLTVQKGRDGRLPRIDTGGLEVSDVIEKPFVAERLLQAVEHAVQRSAERTDPRMSFDPLSALSGIEDPGDMERTDRFLIDFTSPGMPGALVGGIYTAPLDDEKTQTFEALLGSAGVDLEGGGRAAGSSRAPSHRDGRRTDRGPDRGPERGPDRGPDRGPSSPRGEIPTMAWREPPSTFPEPMLEAVPSKKGRLARMTARLREVIAAERIRVDPAEVVLLAHACDTALAEEALFDRPSGDGELAFGGHLEHLPIDQILQLASTVAQPARCRLEHEDQAVEIFFRGGQVVFARQDNMPEGFTLGRVLEASGVLDQRDVERSLGVRSGTIPRGMAGRIGQRLVDSGVIRPAELEEGLRRQVEELVFEVVRWPRGRFAVFAREVLPAEAEDAGLALPVHHLLLEGMRRLDELRRMAREVGDGVVLGRADASALQGVIESLRPEERLLLEQVDGRRTVEDLVRSIHRPAFDVVKALHQLRDRRLVTVVAPAASA